MSVPLICLYWKYTVGNDPLQRCVSKYLQGTKAIPLSNKKGWKDLLLASGGTPYFYIESFLARNTCRDTCKSMASIVTLNGQQLEDCPLLEGEKR